jgi:hypothetical protein
VHEKRLEVDRIKGGRREEERILMENIPTMFANFPAKKLEKPKKSVANRNAVTCKVIVQYCTTCILADRSVFMDWGEGVLLQSCPEHLQDCAEQYRTMLHSAGRCRAIHNAEQLQDSAGLCRTVKCSAG